MATAKDNKAPSQLPFPLLALWWDEIIILLLLLACTSEHLQRMPADVLIDCCCRGVILSIVCEWLLFGLCCDAVVELYGCQKKEKNSVVAAVYDRGVQLWRTDEEMSLGSMTFVSPILYLPCVGEKEEKGTVFFSNRRRTTLSSLSLPSLLTNRSIRRTGKDWG